MTDATDNTANKPDFSKFFQEEGAVVLLRGKNSFGDKIYSYVKVSNRNIERLQECIRSRQPFNSSDFGEVVAAGTGEPTAEVIAELASQYPMLDQPKPVIAAPPAPVQKKAWDEY
jgi:hypothetical protein